jgi:hypothetical protein
VKAIVRTSAAQATHSRVVLPAAALAVSFAPAREQVGVQFPLLSDIPALSDRSKHAEDAEAAPLRMARKMRKIYGIC